MIPTPRENATSRDLRTRGLAAAKAGDFSTAAILLARAIDLGADSAPLRVNLAAVLHALGRNTESVAMSDSAIAMDPTRPEAHNNRCLGLNALHRWSEAIQSADLAIKLRPKYAEAHNNRGVALHASGDLPGAVRAYQDAIAIKHDYARAWSNVGFALQSLAKFDEAADAFGRALALDSSLPDLPGAALHLQMRRCDWHDISSKISALTHALARGERAGAPFALLGLIDSPELHRQAAHLAAAAISSLTKAPAPIQSPAENRTDGRIRIGYFSADYFNHATTHLISGLIEAHDRSAFEIFGFSLGSSPADSYSARIRDAFDRFVDVSAMADEAVVALSQAMQIDIAVDLKGYTEGARPGVFAARAAPVQVSYLGYAGTMAAPWFDYLIADHVVIPVEARMHYDEKIVFMPSTYQVNDRNRARPSASGTPQDLGLPPDAFVFCSFNNTFKITPVVFDSWMRILHAVPDSVLWLLRDNDAAVRNLRAAAEKRGISASRLVFAERCPPEVHLARHHFANLFLDTSPYNAHTTASDALWMGVPVVTQIGRSFPARVASSLLSAAELSDLITHSAEEYEALAISLAREKDYLRALRERLEYNRRAGALFDTRIFTEHLEAAYRAMWKSWRAGVPPSDINPPTEKIEQSEKK